MKDVKMKVLPGMVTGEIINLQLCAYVMALARETEHKTNKRQNLKDMVDPW
jgi:hypothetical protein